MVEHVWTVFDQITLEMYLSFLDLYRLGCRTLFHDLLLLVHMVHGKLFLLLFSNFSLRNISRPFGSRPYGVTPVPIGGGLAAGAGAGALGGALGALGGTLGCLLCLAAIGALGLFSCVVAITAYTSKYSNMFFIYHNSI
jgi:hypothetical protein